MNDTKKKCCPMRFIISVVLVFAFLTAYNIFVHQHLLMNDYMATPNLWRSNTDMKALGCWWALVNAVLAIVFTCFFKKFSKNYKACHCGPECPCKTDMPKTKCRAFKSGGLCFGIKIGLIMGTMMAATYLYIPITLEVALDWFAAYLIEGICIGFILGKVNRIKKSGCAMSSCATKDKA